MLLRDGAMTKGTWLCLWSCIVTVATVPHGPSAYATIAGGGGTASHDCLLVFDAPVNQPATKPKNVVCTDGDPACDADATVNGVCDVRVAVCANSTFNPACTLSGVASVSVAHAEDNASDPDFDPDFQALQTRIDNQIAPPTSTADDCTTAGSIRVAIRGPFNGRCSPGKKSLRITTLSSLLGGKVYADIDKLKLRCVPADDGCEAQALFAGTFDRVQRQIFDQSCARSGCHDSQSVAGGLLLESGASYTNLINVVPSNFAAANSGWRRVLQTGATTGDAELSFLYHKVTGGLAAGMGKQMPLDRKPLHGALIDVLRLWIDAGAPQTGWVPGTER